MSINLLLITYCC